MNEKELNALSYGLYFCIPTKKINKELGYLGFENFLSQISWLETKISNSFNNFKANLVAIAHNYTNTTPDKCQNINTKEMVNIINAIKKNNKIVIAKPDKGSGIVLLDKKEYLDKINEILNDSTKFVKLGQTSEFDNLNKTENSTIDFLKKLVNNNEIEQSIFMAIKPIGSIRPRMYGLPKLHK